MNQIKFAIDAGHLFSKSVSTGWDKPVCTRGILWRQHYVTTCKEYLTNTCILFKYFELAFFQLGLHLVKISCKLIIIWLNYERKKKSVFLLNTVYPVYKSEWVSVCVSLLGARALLERSDELRADVLTALQHVVRIQSGQSNSTSQSEWSLWLSVHINLINTSFAQAYYLSRFRPLALYSYLFKCKR